MSVAAEAVVVDVPAPVRAPALAVPVPVRVGGDKRVNDEDGN